MSVETLKTIRDALHDNPPKLQFAKLAIEVEIDAALKAAQPQEYPSSADDEATRWRHGEPTQPERVSVPISDLKEAMIWLDGALKCKSFVWDHDQHEFARSVCDRLFALLAAAQEGK